MLVSKRYPDHASQERESKTAVRSENTVTAIESKRGVKVFLNYTVARLLRAERRSNRVDSSALISVVERVVG